ncbi:MAG: hypothetical protein QOH32_1805 [Bradyrhizobium sp.]|jgi:hypothetical protein|nr:hypothetical protein [Bradyrhizobium sp.]
MPTSATLFYAWAVPAFSSGSPVDHTWVTTYDNRVHIYPNDAQVAAAGEFYWYCWGAFHPQGGTPVNPTGYLGQQSGDLLFAQCLVQPNADSRSVAAARGTIFTYGVDGVCHQLANQVLYATGTGGPSPLTVVGSRGYMASTFIYGTYGLQHAAWATRIASCSGGVLPVAGGPGSPGGTSMASDSIGPDDFEQRAREVLEGEDPELLSDLLALRTDVHRFAAQRWPGTGQPAAEPLNARNQQLLNEAARLLGPDRYREIFGVEPGEKIDLVDPKINATAGQIFPQKVR